MTVLALFVGLAAAQAEPPPCTAATARTVAVQSVARVPSRWQGRCVRLSGPVLYSALYSGVEGFYLSQRNDPEGQALRGNLRHRLGLYGEVPWPETIESWTLVGTVDTCERRSREARRETEEQNRRYRAAGSDQIVIHMLAGYCHYYPGAVLVVTEAHPGPPAHYERRVGAAARQAHGNLIIGYPGLPHYRDLRRRAEAFRAALSAGDRERLSELHGRFGAHRDELDQLLEDPDSPFRELRGDGDFPFVILYLPYDDRGRALEEQRRRDGYICYCRGPDCEGRWPIATVDTGSRRDHPYACVSVSEDGAGHVFMRAGLRPAPLSEPAPEAFAGSN